MPNSSKSQLIFNFFIALIAFIATILFLISCYEYYNVEILENINNYPFGMEGPVAGIEHYESPIKYADMMLKTAIITFISSILLWFGIFKENLKLIISGIVLMIIAIIYPNFDLFVF